MRHVLIVAASFNLAAFAAFGQGLGGIDPRASVPLPPTGPTCLSGVNESGQPIPDPRCAPVMPWLPRAAPDHAPGSCHVRLAANGMKLPDPACSPGAVNPTLTVEVLLNPAFRTDMVRDKLTSAAAKRRVYAWYGIAPPKNNTGPNQVCELDHVVDLASGGADSLDNLWPECGEPNVPVGEREFKTKDRFAEHDVMRLIKAGGDLADLQRRIAADWTQFLPTH